MFTSSVIAGILRHVLTAIGGALVAKGYIGAENVDTIVGAIVTLSGAVMSVRAKRAV